MIPLDPGLLATILADPADDAARLVAADWLEEHGETARAEFIRVQVHLAKVLRAQGNPPYYRFPSQEETLSRRERELFQQSPETHDWFGPAFDLARVGSDWWSYLDWFRRGFISLVRCPLADWLAHGAAIVAAHPVERVALTGVQPAPDSNARHSPEWHFCFVERTLPLERHYLPLAWAKFSRGGRLRAVDDYSVIWRFPGEQSWQDALSAVALAWAKSAATDLAPAR